MLLKHLNMICYSQKKMKDETKNKKKMRANNLFDVQIVYGIGR